MKVAIYSGPIPSTPFIENLIRGLSSYHTIYLFGTRKKSVRYSSKRIRVIETPASFFLNFFITLYRVFLLLFINYKLVWVAFKEAKTYPTLYVKWMRFSRFIPVLLYKPDIFHLQWASEINRWVFLKKAIGCKLVVSLRGTNINILPKVDEEIARRYECYFPQVDAFHAVSEAIALEVKPYVTPDQPLLKIPSILSSYLPEKIEFRPISKDTLNLVSVGRHDEIKGYKFSIRAIKILRDQGVLCTYTIIARGQPSDELLDLRHSLGLDDYVVFDSQFYDQSILFEKMKDYQILLLPSLSEGLANVVLEGMALGIPIVASDCGGMAEVVKEETGWLVPIRNPEAIATAILEVMQVPEETLRRITLNAYDFVKEHFNADRSIQQFLELYEDVLGDES